MGFGVEGAFVFGEERDKVQGFFHGKREFG